MDSTFNFSNFRSSGRWIVFVTVTSSSGAARSEEHTSELQSQSNLVCRLLLEKKKNISISAVTHLGASPTRWNVSTQASCGTLPRSLQIRCHWLRPLLVVAHFALTASILPHHR